MTFEELLNAPEPPERIHAAEVDLYAETHTISSNPQAELMSLHWHRRDGRTLHYARWIDADGHWFYPVEEVRRRAKTTQP